MQPLAVLLEKEGLQAKLGPFFSCPRNLPLEILEE